MRIKQALYDLYDFFMPRLVTEEVAVNLEGDSYQPVMALGVVEPDEQFDGICTIKAVSWLGTGWFGRMTLPPRPFVNPHDARG